MPRSRSRSKTPPSRPGSRGRSKSPGRHITDDEEAAAVLTAYKAPAVAPPAVVLARPSVSNNQPLTGWHRTVVLTGALLCPYDAAVVHWPPYNDGKRKHPLRSKAEVLKGARIDDSDLDHAMVTLTPTHAAQVMHVHEIALEAEGDD